MQILDTKWLWLVYKVPAEPSARRVYVWRKLKRLGAIVVHDAVWVLPATGRTREQFQWLAAEILENGGDAMVLEGTQLFQQQDESLRQQFMAQTDSQYQAVLTEIQQAGADSDLADLSRRYQQIKSQDYFQSELGQQVREALMHARGEGDL